MKNQGTILRAVGIADACELLSCLFAYPNEAFAEGLVTGAVAQDAESCLIDAGVAEETAKEAALALRSWGDADAAELFGLLRRTYTKLYLAPGGKALVFPYETAFRHVERGLPGKPSLFRTSVTIDVERQMREAGVRAKNDRTEPCDSVFEEFEFLSYLAARWADALTREAEDEAARWEESLARFDVEHGASWLRPFMGQTKEKGADTPYAAFAEVGLKLLEVLP